MIFNRFIQRFVRLEETVETVPAHDDVFRRAKARLKPAKARC
jgi:hypothetical protein